MMKSVIVESTSGQTAHDFADRVRRNDATPLLLNTDATVRAVRVPEDFGVLFQPSGSARIGGYDHLGLSLDE